MPIDYQLVKHVDPLEWLDQHSITVQVKERTKDAWGTSVHYYATVKDGEIRDGGMLRGAIASGRVPEEALLELWKLLSGEWLVLHASDPAQRREILVPKLRHWKV